MSYLIDDFDKARKQAVRYFVRVNTSNQTSDTGMTLLHGGEPTYPPSVVTDSVIKSMASALDG
jgi:hypothetical protein